METAEVYNITDEWNELVADNKWKKGQKVLVQLWSFRRNHKLYFALVKLSKDELGKTENPTCQCLYAP
ncbi:hypothetical protein RYX36_010345 [Vicia faba]